MSQAPSPDPPCILALDMRLPTDAATPGLVHANSADLDAAMLARLQPARVILPLLAQGQDASEVIVRLEALGYVGLLTVIAPNLPNPQMVERELRRHGPGARLTVLSA